ncbi:MAG: hypothetical protein ABI206_03260 [Antricoccus sp.]
MESKRWTQVGYMPVAILVIVLILFCRLLIDHRTDPVLWVAIGAIVLLIVALSSMTIELRSDAIVWWFGGRILRRTLSFDRITEVSVRETPIVAGFGIRMSSSGTLWAVGGSQMLELSQASGRTILLGSSHASAICAEMRPLCEALASNARDNAFPTI